MGLKESNDSLVKEQAVWAIGNIAGDKLPCRDYLLHLGAMQLLMDVTKTDVKLPLRRNAVWAMSNLCRGKPVPPFEAILPAIPVFAELLKDEDETVVSDACWAISYISDEEDDRKMQSILKRGVAQSIVVLLGSKNPIVQTPALRVMGNIVTGSDFQTQLLISAGCLPVLKALLDDPATKKNTKREVCWTLSNITAGSKTQIAAVIEASVADSLIYHMKESDFDICKEAAWAIANATSSASPEQITKLVQKGCIEPLCQLVRAPDIRVVSVSLEGIDNILKNGENLKAHNNHINPFVQVIEHTNSVGYLEELLEHPNMPIYDKAKSILSTYFNYDGEEQNTPNVFSLQTDKPATGFSF